MSGASRSVIALDDDDDNLRIAISESIAIAASPASTKTAKTTTTRKRRQKTPTSTTTTASSLNNNAIIELDDDDDDDNDIKITIEESKLTVTKTSSTRKRQVATSSVNDNNQRITKPNVASIGTGMTATATATSPSSVIEIDDDDDDNDDQDHHVDNNLGATATKSQQQRRHEQRVRKRRPGDSVVEIEISPEVTAATSASSTADGATNGEVQVVSFASASSSSSSSSVVKKKKKKRQRQQQEEKPPISSSSSPLLRIIEVFPDIDHNHVKMLLQTNNISSNSISTNTITSIVNESIEMKIQSIINSLIGTSYPKSKKDDNNSSNIVDFTTTNDTTGIMGNGFTGNGSTTATTAIVAPVGHNNWKYDYMLSTSFEPTSEYIKQCHQILDSDFPFLSKVGVKKHLTESKEHYAICHDRICKLIMGTYNNNNNDNNKKKAAAATAPSSSSGQQQQQQISDEDKQYQQDCKQLSALNAALTGKVLSLRQEMRLNLPSGVSTTLKRPRSVRKAAPLQTTDPILKDEIKYVKHKLTTFKGELEQRIQLHKSRKQSEKDGTTVECTCCYMDYSLDEMISCKNEGHLFCMYCLKRHAEEKIYGQGNFGIHPETKKPLAELQCMSADGCTSTFDYKFLQKSLTEKSLQKYNEIQFNAAVDNAGLSNDLCTCPKCGYKASLPESEMIFVCPVVDCKYESCRKCGKESHIPLRCDEVEKDKAETKGRLKVEEAISAAKIRTCPTCTKKFVKESGCNKMTCSCGTWICYICRSVIPKSGPKSGYNHFCNIPHCNMKKCNGCHVHSNAEEDDKLAMRDAGIKAAEEVREHSLTSSSNNNNGNNGIKASSPLDVDNNTNNNNSEVRIDVDTLLNDPAGTASSSSPHRRRRRNNHHRHQVPQLPFMAGGLPPIPPHLEAAMAAAGIPLPHGQPPRPRRAVIPMPLPTAARRNNNRGSPNNRHNRNRRRR